MHSIHHLRMEIQPSCPSWPRRGGNPKTKERNKLPQPNPTGSFESQKRNCRRIQRSSCYGLYVEGTQTTTMLQIFG